MVIQTGRIRLGHPVVEVSVWEVRYSVLCFQLSPDRGGYLAAFVLTNDFEHAVDHAKDLSEPSYSHCDWPKSAGNAVIRESYLKALTSQALTLPQNIRSIARK